MCFVLHFSTYNQPLCFLRVSIDLFAAYDVIFLMWHTTLPRTEWCENNVSTLFWRYYVLILRRMPSWFSLWFLVIVYCSIRPAWFRLGRCPIFHVICTGIMWKWLQHFHLIPPQIARFLSRFQPICVGCSTGYCAQDRIVRLLCLRFIAYDMH